jgi:VWFA-related protein
MVACLITDASRAEPQVTPTFPSAIELVRIDVVVLDRDGRPVTGLTAADFEVTEGGKPHEIASFEPVIVRVPPPAPASLPTPAVVSESMAPTPAENRYFLIFFDDVHVSARAAERVRTQLVPFIEHETRDGDWVTIVAPLAGLKWTSRTAYERRQLPAVIQGLKGRFVRKLRADDPTQFDAMRMSEYGGREYRPPPGAGGLPAGASVTSSPGTPKAGAKPTPGLSTSGPGAGTSPEMLAEEVYAVAKRGVRKTLSGLSDAILSMAGFRGRKSLIVYSEGFMKSPSMADYDQAIEVARRAGVSVRVVDPRGVGTGEPSPDGMDDGGPTLILLDQQAGGSSYVAQATGGRVSMSNDLTTPLREAAVEASAYYLIGFQPSGGEPGERKVKVRVRRDGLKIRSPERYLVGDAAAPAKPIPPAIRALGQVADSTDIPLRVATLFLDVTATGDPTTTVAVELPPVADEKRERQLTLLVEARPLGQGEPARDSADMTLPLSDKPAVATRELHLHPGVWQARVVVRDPRTEKLGSVLHTFEVPDTSHFWVSSPILSDRLERSRAPRPALRLDRSYRPADALYCQYRVFGAAADPSTGRPRVTGSYVILRGGRTVQEGPASPIEPASASQVMRLIGFGLAGFEAGDYTLVLRVTDGVSGDTRERTEPFTVVAPES